MFAIFLPFTLVLQQQQQQQQLKVYLFMQYIHQKKKFSLQALVTLDFLCYH